MGDVKTPRRGYHSQVRADAALRTRRAIVAAARELFLEVGYTAASLRAVADLAGVARPTVTAVFGSKPALLRQLVDEALAGDDEPVPVARRPWFAPVLEATDPQAVLDAYAGVCTLIGSRAAGIFEVVHRAAGDSPELTELWATLVRNRRFGAEMVVRRAVETGPVRDDVPAEHVIDSLWMYNDPGLYTALIVDRGWPEAQFTAWLAGQMRAAVLGLPDAGQP
ncbi:MAG: TetR/AcrR family transcriptional regulator [Pseudonocardiaceae bacterium]|nr:MAG: TetR/AcrR family transcriptional regulator [Pseudonocardiaceae bacterium]